MRYLKIAFGLTLLTVIYVKVGLAEVTRVVAAIGPLSIAAALGMFVADLLLRAVSLKIFADVFARVSFLAMFRHMFHSWAIGLLTPGKVGELSLAYFLTRDGLSLGQGTAVAVVDKFVTVVVLVTVGAFGSVRFLGAETATLVIAASLLGLTASGGAILSERMRGVVKRYVLRTRAALFTGFFDSFIRLVLRPKILLNVAVTLVRWLVTSYMSLVLFLAAGVDIPVLDILIISGITTIVALVPITINGLGTSHGVAIYLFGMLGVDLEFAAAVLLLITIMTYVVAGIGTLIMRRES